MIRKFKKEDAEQCSKIILACVKQSRNITGKNREFMMKSNTPEGVINKTKDRELYVQVIKRKIIGTGALSKNEIRTMFVSPNFQRKKYGKLMLDFLINKAKKQGLKKVWLKSATSPKALNFYKKNGFNKVGIRNDFGFKTIEMEKKYDRSLR